MNSTKSNTAHGGLTYDTIADIALGAVNIGMAAAYPVLDYLTYRASRSKLFNLYPYARERHLMLTTMPFEGLCALLRRTGWA